MQQKTMSKKLNWLEEAESQVKKAKEERYLPTTTQLRKIFAHLNKIKNIMEISFVNDEHAVQGRKLYDNLSYFKLQIVYQMAREKNVKQFVEQTDIIAKIGQINNKRTFDDFCKYMEAIIAYQKFYGRDN